MSYLIEFFAGGAAAGMGRAAYCASHGQVGESATYSVLAVALFAKAAGVSRLAFEATPGGA